MPMILVTGNVRWKVSPDGTIERIGCKDARAVILGAVGPKRWLRRRDTWTVKQLAEIGHTLDWSDGRGVQVIKIVQLDRRGPFEWNFRHWME